MRMRPDTRQWLQQDTLQNMLNGMLKPETAPKFFASTVLQDPMIVFKNLNVPMVILDATGNHQDYRDSTPTADNERLQKLHPELIVHKTFPVGHFVHRAAPEAFIDSLVQLKGRLSGSTQQ